MQAVDQAHGKVLVVSAHHDGGKKLRAFGGIGAFLRYAIG